MICHHIASIQISTDSVLFIVFVPQAFSSAIEICDWGICVQALSSVPSVYMRSLCVE